MNNDKKILCTVNANSWPWRYTFVLTKDELIQEWKKVGGTGKGCNRYPLADLDSRLSRQMEFAHGSRPFLQKAVMYLAGSACVFFSQFNHQIPLLAPFLALFGIRNLINGVCRLKQYEWTILERKNGQRATSIQHSSSNRSERELFEKLFVQAMNDQIHNINSANKASEATSRPTPDAGLSSPQG